MARPTPDAIYEPTRRPEPFERPCQHGGCAEAGLYRAPKSRDRLHDYYWFCLDHVRDYNAAWDYFTDMDEDEIEAQRRVDTVWERPTWPLGADLHRAETRARAYVDGEFGEAGQSRHRHASGPRREDEKALAVLGLKRPITFPEIKARYKQLVKRLHPDANGGDRETEEKLKLVNEAYATLKHSFVQ